MAWNSIVSVRRRKGGSGKCPQSLSHLAFLRAACLTATQPDTTAGKSRRSDKLQPGDLQNLSSNFIYKINYPLLAFLNDRAEMNVSCRQLSSISSRQIRNCSRPIALVEARFQMFGSNNNISRMQIKSLSLVTANIMIADSDLNIKYMNDAVKELLKEQHQQKKEKINQQNLPMKKLRTNQQNNQMINQKLPQMTKGNLQTRKVKKNKIG